MNNRQSGIVSFLGIVVFWLVYTPLFAIANEVNQNVHKPDIIEKIEEWWYFLKGLPMWAFCICLFALTLYLFAAAGKFVFGEAFLYRLWKYRADSTKLEIRKTKNARARGLKCQSQPQARAFSDFVRIFKKTKKCLALTFFIIARILLFVNRDTARFLQLFFSILLAEAILEFLACKL